MLNSLITIILFSLSTSLLARQTDCKEIASFDAANDPYVLCIDDDVFIIDIDGQPIFGKIVKIEDGLAKFEDTYSIDTGKGVAKTNFRKIFKTQGCRQYSLAQTWLGEICVGSDVRIERSIPHTNIAELSKRYYEVVGIGWRELAVYYPEDKRIKATTSHYFEP